MKTEDFERLKKLCDENGFELVTESPDKNDKFFVVKKKRIKVKPYDVDVNIENGVKYFDCRFIIDGVAGKRLEQTTDFLSEQLEKYLNNEI